MAAVASTQGLEEENKASFPTSRNPLDAWIADSVSGARGIITGLVGWDDTGNTPIVLAVTPAATISPSFTDFVSDEAVVGIV